MADFDTDDLVLFSEEDVRCIGINMVSRKTPKQPLTVFRSHFGVSPVVLADQFLDIQLSQDPDVLLDADDHSVKGLQGFLAAHYWLFVRPKSSRIMSTHLDMPERECRGKPLWRWIQKIHYLSRQKIWWEERMDVPLSEEFEQFTITLDGTDFKTWEPKHPTRPIDRTYASHKFKAAGLRYELAISIKTGRCVWINGPFPAGTHDMTIFRTRLKQKIQPGKAIIADCGYQTSQQDEKFMCTLIKFDSALVDKFKIRSRCRHKSFNGKIKQHGSMEQTWKNTPKKHKWAFVLVVLTLHYVFDA